MASARQAFPRVLGAVFVALLMVQCLAPVRTDVARAPAPEPAAKPSQAAPEPTAKASPAASASVVAPAAPEPSPAASASAVAPAVPQPPPTERAVARRTYVVAAIGDSLTDFRAHGGGYLKALQERCPESRFESFGKGGDMVNQMRKRLEKDVLAAPSVPYTHLIVFGGVNDLYSDQTAGRTVAKIAKDLSAMYADAHHRGMKVIALTVSPWGGFHRYFTEARGATTLALNRFIVDQQKTGAADFVVDTYPLLSCGDPQKLCDALAPPFHDGLHFGPAAHQKIADALYDAVFSDCR